MFVKKTRKWTGNPSAYKLNLTVSCSRNTDGFAWRNLFEASVKLCTCRSRCLPPGLCSRYAERSDHGKGNVGSNIRGHGHDTIGSVLTTVKRDTPDTYVCDNRQHMCWIITIFIPVSVPCHERQEAPPRQKCVCMYACMYVYRQIEQGSTPWCPLYLCDSGTKGQNSTTH